MNTTFYNILLFLAILFFIGLLGYGFPDSSSPWFDEGINLGITKSLVKHGVLSLETAPGEFVSERSLLITTNYPLLSWIALSFKFFGIGLWQAKIVMIVFLILFAALFYLLAKKYYGRENAIWSFALLVTFLPLYGNGKSVLGEIPGLVYFLGGLLLLDKDKKWKIFVSGFLFGLASATKSIYLLLAVSVAIGEIWEAIKQKELPARQWLCLVGGMAAPLLLWLYTLLPENFTINYFTDTFRLYSNPYNAESTVLPNLLRFFTESTPMHFAIILAAFVFYKFFTNSKRWLKIEIVLISFILMNLVFYLRTVGWYRYFFPSHVLLFIFFPAAVAGVFEKINVSGAIKKYAPIAALSVFLLAQIATLATNIRDPLYYNPAPRAFAKPVNKAVPEGQGIFIVDLPEIVFLLNRDDVWHYLHANPHISFGKNLLGIGEEPHYVISNLSPGENYDIKIDAGKYILYERKK